VAPVAEVSAMTMKSFSDDGGGGYRLGCAVRFLDDQHNMQSAERAGRLQLFNPYPANVEDMVSSL